MVGEADLTDPAVGFVLVDPFTDAELLELFPLGDIREHMHEIVVDMIGAQARQLLVKCLVDGLHRPEHIVRELRCDPDFVPAVILVEHPAQQDFAARVDIGRVEIIDAALDS